MPSAGIAFSNQRLQRCRYFIPVGPCAASQRRTSAVRKHMENRMPTFILSLNWTDQGIRSVKDAPKRAQAARELAKKVEVEIKEVYLTSGDNDLLIIVDTPNGTMSPSSRSRSARRESCVPGPPALGLSPNFKS